ncbi:hypothetical protein CBS147332_4382 [Penicillium roqueforti]|nr:hypothetical protein CBS147332_4382 [Penicillium roqueforti]KAI3118150.1 hypothetical protein CBS147331_3089 [Penicillium roqueforti]
MVEKPYLLTATQVRDILQKNTITVEEYAHSLLARIEERDCIVKAWAFLDPAFVLSQARELDRIPQDQRGPLHGLVIGIKDIMNTKGEPISDKTYTKQHKENGLWETKETSQQK